MQFLGHFNKNLTLIVVESLKVGYKDLYFKKYPQAIPKHSNVCVIYWESFLGQIHFFRNKMG